MNTSSSNFIPWALTMYLLLAGAVMLVAGVISAIVKRVAAKAGTGEDVAQEAEQTLQGIAIFSKANVSHMRLLLKGKHQLLRCAGRFFAQHTRQRP